MAKSIKYVYTFGNKKADGDGSMKALLGGKGANLAEMTKIGLPVPPGFTITTEVCTYYYANKRKYPTELKAQVKEGVAFLEKRLGKKFNDKEKPLLVSVRSGARVSMPGMMDTILNLGLNDQTVLALAKASNNERFAWDCYRRFVQMYGDVVMGVQKGPGEDRDPFEKIIEELKEEIFGGESVEDTRLDVEALTLNFPQILGNSLKEPLVQSLALGTTNVPLSTGANMVIQMTGALLSMYRQWFLVIWVTPPAQASPLLEIRQQVKKSSMVNS